VAERGDQARRRGLVYAGALLGVWIVLAGEPDVSDLIAGSAAAVFSVGVGYFLSERGKMVPGLRAGHALGSDRESPPPQAGMV
jgi:hypothetical protein